MQFLCRVGTPDGRVLEEVMTASDDISGLKQQAAQWTQDIAGSRLVEIADAGHFMLVEQPDASAGAILDWLLSLDLVR